jgi:hypothetical protein
MGINRENVVRELVFENNKLNHALILMAKTIQEEFLEDLCDCCILNGTNECKVTECVQGTVKYYKSKSGMKGED